MSWKSVSASKEIIRNLDPLQEADFTVPDEYGADGLLNVERELEAFRRQWHDEIGRHRPPAPAGVSSALPVGGERGTRGDALPLRHAGKGQEVEEPSIEEQVRLAGDWEEGLRGQRCIIVIFDLNDNFVTWF